MRMPKNEDLEAVAASVCAGARPLSESGRRVPDRIAVVAIASGWAALVAIVNPIGEVILNDDGQWAYAVKSVLATGSLKLSPWTAPNLLSQVYWGVLFCLPFGFSHTALRLSTLTLALAALLALYGLLREAGAAPPTALFGVLILALNPLFFELSFTYMTDVPFLAFTLVATYLLVRGVKRQSRVELALGLLAATAALLTRQSGLALFLALSVSYLAKKGLSRRNAMVAAVPALLGLAVQFSYQTWLKMTGRMPAMFGKQALDLLDVKSISMWPATKEVGFALMYVGLFVLPLLLFVGYGPFIRLVKQQRWIAILTSVIVFTLGAVPLIRGHRMPLRGNVLYDTGLGPVMIRHDQPLPSAPVFWIAVTVIGILTSALVVLVLVSAVLQLVRTRGRNQELLLMLLATGGIYFAPLPLLPSVYDRYYLLLVPVATVVTFMVCSRDNAPSRRRTAIALLCLLTYGAFAIAGTHDYLAWNRTRWQVLRTLTGARHLHPKQIDGGFEFNIESALPGQKWPEPVDYDFAISFGPSTGYAEAERYTFRRWLPPGEGTILLLRKISSAPTLRTTGSFE